MSSRRLWLSMRSVGCIALCSGAGGELGTGHVTRADA
jgi:hypothetical protein